MNGKYGWRARAAMRRIALIAFGLIVSAEALAACCKNYQEFAEHCRAQGGIPSPADRNGSLRCSPQPTTTTTSPSPQPRGRDYGAEEQQRRSAEEAEAAAAQAAAAEEKRRKEDAEQQAKFLRDRDAAAGSLKGSIGTSVGANSSGGTQLRGSQVETGIREINQKRDVPRDVSGPQAAWKQLHCAASILSPAILALNLGGGVGVKADYSEFRFLADEALNALNGQKLGVACANAPDMPRASGRDADLGRVVEVEKALVAKTRDLATKLEDARRKQDDAQATLRAGAAPKADSGTADVIEQQRRINRARDNAGNEMAKAQREFNEGKRGEESAKKELIKIQVKVESVVRGERVTFDEEPPVASRTRQQEKKQ